MKTFEQFINESNIEEGYQAVDYNAKVLSIEDLAEYTSRLQNEKG